MYTLNCTEVHAVLPPIAHALTSRHDSSEDGSGRGTPLVPVALRGHSDYGDGLPSLRSSGGDCAGGSEVLVPVAYGFQPCIARNGNGDMGETCHTLSAQAKSGDTTPCVAFDNRGKALYNKGINQRSRNASAQEADPGNILPRVREQIGEKAFTQWGLGILDSLLPPEVLRQALHGKELRPAPFTRSFMVYCALSCPKDLPARAMQSLRETQCQGCPSQRREPPEQLCRELGAYLSLLSQPGAQAEKFMHDLWQSSKGAGVLREALSAVQEVRGSTDDQKKPAHSGFAVRRLTVTECEFLQGFPRNYTLVPYRGKPACDGPRYKALGNSMAVPCMRWIGERLAAVDKIPAQPLHSALI